jgi:phosphotransferase system  glucose/maltose/N-acetylglucosamine-specific IIC component
MDKEQQELYENARNRLRQKKLLYYHFVFLIIGSIFLFVINVLLKFGAPDLWYIWVCTCWVFLFVIHFIKVFIINRFMNKEWERDQINRLIQKQKNKIADISNKTSQDKTS